MSNETREPSPPEAEPPAPAAHPAVPELSPLEKRQNDLNEAFWGGNSSSVRTTHTVMPGNVRGGVK